MKFAFNRRWFRFSLRTLFVAMTLLGGWLGYELNWLRERHAMLAAREAWVLEGSTPNLSLAALQAHLPPKERGPATAPGGLWRLASRGSRNCGCSSPTSTRRELANPTRSRSGRSSCSRNRSSALCV